MIEKTLLEIKKTKELVDKYHMHIFIFILYTIGLYAFARISEIRSWVAFDGHPVIQCYGKGIFTDPTFKEHEEHGDRNYCFIVEPFTITDIQ